MIRADFDSAQNIQPLHGFFARTEFLVLAGFDSLRGKTTEVKLERHPL